MKVELWGDEWAEEAPGHDCGEHNGYERCCYFVEHRWWVNSSTVSVACVGSNCGSEQEFDKKPISRGFPKSHEFGLGDGHTLSLEE
jgi:hypothetical protein